MTAAGSCLAGATAAIGVLLTGPVAAGAEQASRIVDRTLVCPIGGVGYPDPARFIGVQAMPRLGDTSPSAGVYNAPGAADGLVVSLDTGPDFGRGTGSVRLQGCTPSSVRVRLSSRGLSGGSSALGDRYQCEVAARVLIRLRAVFQRPVTLRREQGGFTARGRIATGSLAVTTLAGRKPIFFASVNDATGKAQIFVRRSGCSR